MSDTCGGAIAGGVAGGAVGLSVAVLAIAGSAVALPFAMFVGLQALTTAIGAPGKARARRKAATDKCKHLNWTADQQKLMDKILKELAATQMIEQDTKDKLGEAIQYGNQIKDNLTKRKFDYMIRLGIFIIINIVVVAVMLIMKDF